MRGRFGAVKNSMKGRIITRTSTDLITLLVKDKGKEKATKITRISRWESLPLQLRKYYAQKGNEGKTESQMLSIDSV